PPEVGPTIAHWSRRTSEPSQALDRAALTLGGPPGPGLAPWWCGLARARRLRRRQVREERLRGLGRSSSVADRGDLEDTTASSRQGDHDEISGPHLPGGLGRLVVDVDLAAVACRGGEAPRLEHPRGPQPLVDADRIERGLHSETVS